jgi:anti-sigma regulatory factor (Ser/Thr protein kinase)
LNSAPCRPLCHAPGCTPGIWYGSGDWTASSETTELLVSELATNAVQAMARQEGHTAVRLQLFGDNARVRIEVWDAGPQPPAPKGPGEDGIPDLEGEGGRGLFPVAALSACWDWHLTQEPAGKVVWREIEAERPELSEVGGRPASQPLLPRRIPRQVHVRPVVVMNDPRGIFCTGFGMDSAI